MENSNIMQVMIYLLNCAVNKKIPKELPKDIDYEKLYQLGRFHSVGAMLSMALEDGGYLTETYMPQQLLKKWTSVRIQAIRKNVLFDAEREKLINYLEDQRIWYMPLKGSVLKEIYPDMGMREMADNDIFFDKNHREKIRKYMIGRGYRVESFGKYVHDVYMKEPIYNFECHIDLFSAEVIPEWASYYSDVKDRLLKDIDNNYGYHFSDEDFYIYMMAHTCKHYNGGGTGIRSLLDTYVYLQAKEDSLNWEYIGRELKKLGIYEIEETFRSLAQKLFAKTMEYKDILSDSEKEQEILLYLMGSGTYGTINNVIRKKMEILQADGKSFTLWTKMKFCLGRLFPGLEHMRKYVPFCYRHKWSIPFFWVYRIIRGFFRHGKLIFVELRVIKKMK